MKNKLTLVLHFAVAGVLCVISAILLHTQMVLAQLAQIGIEISFADRLYMSSQDLLGLSPTYGSIVLIGLGLAFVVTFYINKYTFVKSYYLYVLAGGLAVLTILMAMYPILNITLLAGARTPLGLMLQMFAGCVGGFCFAYLRKNHAHKQAT